MGLFDRISKIFSSTSSVDKDGYWIFVRCDHCGEKLSSRINLNNDLSVEYEGENDQIYHCRKTIVGRTGCFQRIEVKLNFDKNRKIVDRQISGGWFLEADEYNLEEIKQG